MLSLHIQEANVFFEQEIEVLVEVKATSDPLEGYIIDVPLKSDLNIVDRNDQPRYNNRYSY